MNAVATHDADRRRANFYRGTMRDPDAHIVPGAAEVEALAVVKTNIEAQALSQGRTLNSVQLDRALSIAQRLIRALPRDQLNSIASNSSLLKIITDQSLAVAPVTDPRTAVAHPLGAQGHDAGAAQLSGALFAQRGIDGSDRRSNYAALSGSLGHLTESERRNFEALQPFAKLHGLDWMPPRDMLAIGRDGLKAIADVKLQEHSYKRLTGEAHFAAKDVVSFAKYAKSVGIKDANKAAGAIADAVRTAPTEAEQKELSRAFVGYFEAASALRAAPNEPAAQEAMRKAGEHYKATATQHLQRHPEAQPALAAAESGVKIREEYRSTAAKTEAKAEVKDTKNDDLLAAINEPSPPKTEAPKADAKTTPAKTPAATAPKGPKQ